MFFWYLLHILTTHLNPEFCITKNKLALANNNYKKLLNEKVGLLIEIERKQKLVDILTDKSETITCNNANYISAQENINKMNEDIERHLSALRNIDDNIIMVLNEVVNLQDELNKIK